MEKLDTAAKNHIDAYFDFKLTILNFSTHKVASSGSQVTVHYTGTLMNGKQFDSSVGKDPFSFRLGLDMD